MIHMPSEMLDQVANLVLWTMTKLCLIDGNNYPCLVLLLGKTANLIFSQSQDHALLTLMITPSIKASACDMIVVQSAGYSAGRLHPVQIPAGPISQHTHANRAQPGWRQQACAGGHRKEVEAPA